MITCELTEPQMTELQTTLANAALVEAVVHRDPSQTDAQVTAAVQKILADGGFASTTVTLDGNQLSITVTAPPAP